MQLFIADIHLQASQPEITQAFLNYLKGPAREASALTIVGDLFDAWIGDDYQGEFETTIITALHELSDSGTKLAFMHGNRDFLIGETFAQQTGAALLEDPLVLELAGKRCVLMHGDSLCTRDEAYMAFRQQTRNPAWQAQILSMPIEQRIALAQQIRQQSGDANSNKAQDIMDVTPDEVIKTLEANDASIMIHGHTHRPDVHEIKHNGKEFTRYVIGDWRPGTGWQLRIEEDELYLEKFTF